MVLWDPLALVEATEAIRAGQLIAFPTDTVFGVAADPSNPQAVARLLEAKGRGRVMPPPVLIADVSQLEPLVTGLNSVAQGLVDRHWPGALTLVFRVHPDLGWDLGDRPGTIAVRQPDHDLARALLRQTGPLAVSSANLTTKPPALTAQEAREQLGASLAIVLEGGQRPGGQASTVVDVTGGTPIMLREGALGRDALLGVGAT
ncbi:MAG: L-threonylcarbamoyladenylate synthase [Micrococcales bacterium]|nr:L-threonylcarbamoyladenylate synthase [Micrococcales bacterium]